MVEVSFSTISQNFYFHLTPHCYLSAYPNATLTFAVKTSPIFANLPNTTLNITAPFVISKSVEWYTQLNVVLKVWPSLSLAASENIPPEQHLNAMWTVNMVTSVLPHLWTKVRRGPLVMMWRVRWRVWRRWRVSQAKIYFKVCLFILFLISLPISIETKKVKPFPIIRRQILSLDLSSSISSSMVSELNKLLSSPTPTNGLQSDLTESCKGM